MSLPLDRIEELMEGHLFFGGLDSEDRSTILDFSRVSEKPAGSVIFRRGSTYHGFYLVLEGAVQIYRLSKSGRMLVLHVMRPGESFAEMPLFERETNPTYPATAETINPTTLLHIPKRPFLEFVDRHPSACLHMLGQMAQRLRSSVRQLDAISLQDVQERLARHLAHQTPLIPSTEEPTIELDVPKSTLAAELGTVPETLSRALRALEKDDLIQTDRSSITVTDLDGLRRMAMED